MKELAGALSPPFGTVPFARLLLTCLIHRTIPSTLSSNPTQLFLRSKPHLIKMMRRPPPSSKPLADASTEPDFYAISEQLPLSEIKDDDAKVAQNFPRQTAYSFVPPPITSAPPPQVYQPAPMAPPSTVAVAAATAAAVQHPHHLQSRGFFPTTAAPTTDGAPAPCQATAHIAYLPRHPQAPTTVVYTAAPVHQQQTHVAQVQHLVYHPVSSTSSPSMQAMQSSLLHSDPAPAPRTAASAPSSSSDAEFADPLKDMFDKPFHRMDSSDNLFDLLNKPMPPPEYYGGHTFVPLFD